MSHELRTPLNCSLNVLELLSQKVMDGPISKNYIQPAIYSNKLLLNLVNNILDYVLIETKQFNYLFKIFDFKQMLVDCMNLIKI